MMQTLNAGCWTNKCRIYVTDDFFGFKKVSSLIVGVWHRLKNDRFYSKIAEKKEDNRDHQPLCNIMNTIFSHIKKNFLIYTLFFIFTFLFFYRLDYNTLTSWDEAWYASISRAMVQSGDYILMKWNGNPYYDHPPMGFWLIATSYKLFGINEFSTRLPAAILGVLSSILMYLTAIKMFGKKEIGFVTALIMGTCVWYVIRVRSGNLDGQFIFFYIATIYFSVLSRKNFKWFPAATASFACLMLTKTLVGVSAAPLILYLTVGQLFKIKKNIWLFIAGIILFGLIVFPWYYINYKTYADFIQHHFFQIGAREKTFASYFNIHPQQPLFYIHMGIRKWYYFWLLSTAFLISMIIRDTVKRIASSETYFYGFLLLWNLVVLYPFLTSEKTELWHLIPVYLPIAFIIAAAFRKIIFFSEWVYVGMFIIITVVQMKTFYAEVIPANKYTPDDVAISKSVAKYNKKTYLDDDFFPISVYYANRKVFPMYDLSTFGESVEKNTLVGLFKSNEQEFVVITRSWAVENLKSEKIPYRVLEKNNSFTILTRYTD